MDIIKYLHNIDETNSRLTEHRRDGEKNQEVVAVSPNTPRNPSTLHQKFDVDKSALPKIPYASLEASKRSQRDMYAT